MMIQITSVFRLEKREDQQLPDKSFRFPRDVVVLLVRYIVARLLPPCLSVNLFFPKAPVSQTWMSLYDSFPGSSLLSY